jgi:hypothetical protein
LNCPSKKKLKLREVNQELKPIKQILKELNIMNRYKNQPFQKFKVFWQHTQDVQTQEEFTDRMNEAIEEGIEQIKQMVIKLARKWERC